MEARAYLTPAEVARRWRVSPRQVRYMIHNGLIRALLVGKRRWRISEAEVAAYEARCESSKTALAT